jgi:integrase
MASLQARHSRTCALGKPWTPLSKTDGCTCPRGPLFHIVVREGARIHRTAVGRNRREAERALAKVNVQVDEGEFRPTVSIRFSDFGDRWLANLERKETTKESYRTTVAYAKQAFGDRVVRSLRTADVARFNTLLKEIEIPTADRTAPPRTLSASTRAKHLRVLHACLESAVSHGYANRNPVNELPKAERPRPTKKEAAYFTNDELPVLFAKVPDTIADVPNVYRYLFLTALKTGMRQGELLALTWGDIDLAGEAIHVRRSYTDGHVSTPKNHEKRTVDIAADLVETLGEWWGRCGKPENDVLVFPGTTGNYLWPMTILRRELYPAMVDAGVPRVGPTGEKRTFHSFRHTYAKRALENGRQITWLSRHLGHSSLKVTTDVYGHWEAAERKREARQMEGVFGV